MKKQLFHSVLLSLILMAASIAWAEGSKTSDLIFSHDVETHKATDCKKCHGDDEGKKSPEMQACIDCHRDQDQSMIECSFCHEQLNQSTKPKDHTAAWGKDHGRFVVEGKAGECAICHRETSCQKCHRREKPKGHTNFFRRKGHGLTAAVDRERCNTCHRVDQCVRCHRTGTALPNNIRHNNATDCRTCHGGVSHFDNGFNGCRTCHR